MIGFYNYSVIVTYIGVALSVSGMALASTGQFKFAILCLALAGACYHFLSDGSEFCLGYCN